MVEVVEFLRNNPGARTEDIGRLNGTYGPISRRWAKNVVKRLVMSKQIVGREDPEDGRARIYFVSDGLDS